MDANELRGELARRIDSVRERIRAACTRAGRSPNEVTLVAVSKNAPDAATRLLPELGVLHLGENRPQELWRKAVLLPSAVHWHLVGHLQRNKIDRTLPLVELIHSADRLQLLTALEEAAAPRDRPADVLLEVNTSGEPTKQGFAPEGLLGLAEHLSALRHVRVRGLMTLAALEDDPERCRPSFALLRELNDRFGALLSDRHRLDHLSMGMTNDFEVAVEEGSTFVRIGTALFEGLGARM